MKKGKKSIMPQMVSQELVTGNITPIIEGKDSVTYTQIETYHIVLNQDEDGRYVATCPILPGVVTDGASEDEALNNVKEAIAAMHESKEGYRKIIEALQSMEGVSNVKIKTELCR